MSVRVQFAIVGEHAKRALQRLGRRVAGLGAHLWESKVRLLTVCAALGLVLASFWMPAEDLTGTRWAWLAQLVCGVILSVVLAQFLRSERYARIARVDGDGDDALADLRYDLEAGELVGDGSHLANGGNPDVLVLGPDDEEEDDEDDGLVA